MNQATNIKLLEVQKSNQQIKKEMEAFKLHYEEIKAETCRLRNRAGEILVEIAKTRLSSTVQSNY